MVFTDRLEHLQDRPGSLLTDHLRRVSELTVQRMAAALGEGLTAELRRTAEVTGLCHDIGKGTSYFQDYLRDRSSVKKRELTHHSRLGAEAAAFILRRELGEESLLPLLAYGAILRHHGGLDDLEDEVNSQQRGATNLLHSQLAVLDRGLWSAVSNLPMQDLVAFIDNTLVLARLRRRVQKLDEAECFRLFLLGRLLYSCLLWADRADASGTAKDRAGRNPVGLVRTYREQMGFDGSQEGLNGQRSRAYNEVVGNINRLAGEPRLFTLTLPTGLGKTLTGLAAALELRERFELDGPIVYCLPFTAIIDQNAAVYEKVLSKNDLEPTSDRLLVHHHLAEGGYTSACNHELDPDAGHLLLEGWESDLVVTTFVQLGLTLFNNHNRSLRRLHRLAGAVVILDEVQNLPVRYWPLFRRMLGATAELLGTRWILMTATQPAIFSASNDEDGAVELAGDPGAFFEGLRRVELINELAQPMTVAQLAERIRNEAAGKRVLVVVNTIRCALELHSLLQENQDSKLMFLSSEVIPKHRLARISEMKDDEKKTEPLVCVSTQLIEAGVDLDFDVVYRDRAPLDSVVQAAGRCNRGGDESKTGRVVLIKLVPEDDPGKYYSNYVYDSVLLNKAEAVLNPGVIREAELQKLVETYFTEINQAVSAKESRQLLDLAKGHKHGTLAEMFKLIDDKYAKVDLFVIVDDEAEAVWEEYRATRELTGLERRRKMRGLKPRMAPYIISAPKKYRDTEDKVLGVIRPDELERQYERETGFKRD